MQSTVDIRMLCVDSLIAFSPEVGTAFWKQVINSIFPLKVVVNYWALWWCRVFPGEQERFGAHSPGVPWTLCPAGTGRAGDRTQLPLQGLMAPGARTGAIHTVQQSIWGFVFPSFGGCCCVSLLLIEMFQHLMLCVWGNLTWSQLLLHVVLRQSKLVIISTSCPCPFLQPCLLLSGLSSWAAGGTKTWEAQMLQLCNAGPVSAQEGLIYCADGFISFVFGFCCVHGF